MLRAGQHIRTWLLEEKLGSGSYGEVWLVSNESQRCVMKVVSVRGLSRSELAAAVAEGECLRDVPKTFVVQFYGAFRQGELLCLLLQHCENGDLKYQIDAARALRRSRAELLQTLGLPVDAPLLCSWHAKQGDGKGSNAVVDLAVTGRRGHDTNVRTRYGARRTEHRHDQRTASKYLSESDYANAYAETAGDATLARALSRLDRAGAVYADLVALDEFICLHPYLACRGGPWLSERVVRRWLAQALLALAALHGAGVLHRDVKPANLLLDAHGLVRVCDFGVASRAALARTQIGTPLYMGPELHAGRAYGPAVDAWALGATFFELLALRPPFDANTETQLVAAIDARRARAPPPHVSAPMRNALAALLSHDPKKRPAPKELIRSALIQGAIAETLHLCTNQLDSDQELNQSLRDTMHKV